MDNIIFKAELIDKKIKVTLGTSHLPSVIFAQKLLDIQVIDLLVQEQIKQEDKDKPLIKVPGLDIGGVKLN
jgi:hypothetical protein